MQCECCISDRQRYIVWPSLMDALSPAPRGAREFKTPIAWIRSRERDCIKPSSWCPRSLLSARTCAPCGAACCLFSYKALLMSPQICQSLGWEGRIIGCRARSHSARRGVVAASPAPVAPPALHFLPEATELSQGTLEGGWKEWQEFSEVSVEHVFLNCFLVVWNRGEITFPVVRGRRQKSIEC